MSTETPMHMLELYYRIRQDSPSLKAKIEGEKVIITPAFQEDVAVSTWAEYQRAIKEGRICFPDEETCY